METIGILTNIQNQIVQSIKQTQRLVDEVQLTLASGKDVNSAIDDPQNFFTSKSLSNRAQDLTRLLDGIRQNVRALEQADTGITAVQSLLGLAESKVEEGLVELYGGGLDTTSGGIANNILWLDSADQSTILDLEGDTADSGASFSGFVSTWLDKSAVGNDFTQGGPALRPTYTDSVQNGYGTLQFDNADDYLQSTFDINLTSELSVFVVARNNVSQNYNGLFRIAPAVSGLASNLEIYWQGGGNSGNLVYQRGGGTAYIVDNAAGPAIGNFYQVTVTADTGSRDHYIDGVAGTVDAAAGLMTVADGVNPAYVGTGFGGGGATLNGDIAEVIVYDRILDNTERLQVEAYLDEKWQGGGSTTTSIFGSTSNARAEEYSAEYSNILTQIDQLVEDANYRGNNLLGNEDLRTNFNEDRSNTLVTQGIDATPAGLGLTEETFLSRDGLLQALDKIHVAQMKLRTFGSTIQNDLGVIQARTNFTNELVNILKAGADNLTLADQNEKGAQMLALQTRQTLQTTALSLSAQFNVADVLFSN